MSAASPSRPAATVHVNRESLRSGQVLDVAGLGMRAWAADVRRADAMAAALRVATPASSAVVDVRFEDDDAVVRDWADQPFDVQRDGATVVFVRSDLGLVARVTPDGIVVTGDAPDLVVAFRRVFTIAVAHLFVWHGRHVLHAATLGVGDDCVLVLGPSGAGKSTVALCALRCGWPVFGDDLASLVWRDGRVVAAALPRPIAGPADLVQLDDGMPIPGDPRSRRELPPETITPGTRRVAGLVVSAHGASGSTTARELSPLAVLPVVLSAFVATDRREALRAVFPVATALSRLPAIELAHGARAADRLSGGARVLEEFSARLRSGPR